MFKNEVNCVEGCPTGQSDFVSKADKASYLTEDNGLLPTICSILDLPKKLKRHPNLRTTGRKIRVDF
jgi:hypothetical protein